MIPTVTTSTSTTGHSEIDRRAYWRYHFAGLVMQAIWGGKTIPFDDESRGAVARVTARMAILQADALLAELEKGE